MVHDMYTFVECIPSIIVIDPSGRNTHLIRKALANYKARWNTSIADQIGVTSDIDEAKGKTIVVPEFLASQLNPLHYTQVLTVDSMINISMYEFRRAIIEPIVHTYTDVTEFITDIEERNPSVVGADFETASKYSTAQKEEMKLQLEVTEPDSTDAIWLQQQISSDGLSHPSLVRITHLSIAISETESFVCTISKESETAICEWLCETKIKQVWHNASFDFKLIYDRVQSFPRFYEDSQLMWYTILNHADSFQARTGLKHLAKNVYGTWGEGMAENFNLESMHDPDLIHYAGIDTQACLFLYNEANLHPDFQE